MTAEDFGKTRPNSVSIRTFLMGHGLLDSFLHHLILLLLLLSGLLDLDLAAGNANDTARWLLNARSGE
jgi:hypothetical protein